MVLKPSLPPHAAYLATASVHSAIEAVLRRQGVAPPDVEDLRQVVLAQALETSAPPPDLDQCIGLVRKTARDPAIDHFRRRARRSKFDAGPFENPDERAAVETPAEERLDFGKQIAWVHDRIHDGTISPRQAGMLASAADGVPGAAIAREWGLTDQTVRNELSRARKTARLSWAAFVAVGGVVAIVLYGFVSEPDRADRGPEVGGVLPDRLEVAQQLRGRALQECRSERWADCLHDLDRAAQLDPAGDTAPEVQNARADVQRRLQEEPTPIQVETPHSNDKPPVPPRH
jgi:DNA-directed RNA polymerase specialized sigma24 family protein